MFEMMRAIVAPFFLRVLYFKSVRPNQHFSLEKLPRESYTPRVYVLVKIATKNTMQLEQNGSPNAELRTAPVKAGDLSIRLMFSPQTAVVVVEVFA